MWVHGVYDVCTHDGIYMGLKNHWTKKKKNLTGSLGIGTPREELYSLGLSSDSMCLEISEVQTK